MIEEYTIFGFGRDHWGRMGISQPYMIAINEKQEILWGYPNDGQINILFNNSQDLNICQNIINKLEFSRKQANINDYPIQRMLEYDECSLVKGIVFEHKNYKREKPVDAGMGNLGKIIGKYKIKNIL